MSRPVSMTMNLVWGDFCQGGAPRAFSIFLYLSFFVRPGQPFLRPDPTHPTGRRAQERSRLAAHRAATDRLGLDGSKHDGALGRVGMTVGGESACGARKDRAAALYSVGSGDPQPMMQCCASAAKLRERRTH